MSVVHPSPALSRNREGRNANCPDDCKAGFPLPGFALGLAAAALIFSGGQAVALGEWRLGIGEMIVAAGLAIWAGLH